MMKKKKAKPKSATAEQNFEPGQTQKRNDATEAEDKPFDFGGLPNRDLKKNLGCG